MSTVISRIMVVTLSKTKINKVLNLMSLTKIRFMYQNLLFKLVGSRNNQIPLSKVVQFLLLVGV